MCGITGVMCSKESNVGELLIKMLKALQHRGTESTGVAIYSKEANSEDEYIFRIFVKDIVGAISKISTAIASAGGDIRNISIQLVNGYGLDKYLVKVKSNSLKNIVQNINSTGIAKVISVGRNMDIIKDTCSVAEFEEKYNISGMKGIFGLGHVRFSTESRVDLLHAHPFQSFDYPDISVVHNGQITNYWKLRGMLERQGINFMTENDSELIVHYIVRKLNAGLSLYEALSESVKELDGPFSYMVTTSTEIGMVRDKLGLRPLLIYEDEDVLAAASEEVALRIVGRHGMIRNLKPGEVVCWKQKN